MPRLYCNPYIDTPITVKRVFLMALSTIVFIVEVVYGTIRGFIWFGTGNKQKNEATYQKFRELMQFYFKLDMRLHPWLSCEIVNQYHEQFDKGAIAICNHQSLLDTLCLLLVSPKFVIVANRKVIRNPLVRLLLYYAEFACVGDTIDGLKNYCKHQIERGHTVVIFPEGQRSEKCDIKRFHIGAFLLADELKVDIVPIYLHGSGYVLPLHRAIQNNAKMYVEIGKRISYSERMRISPRDMAREMRQSYFIKYSEICRKRENTHYFYPMIINLFGLIHKSRKVRKLLNEYNDFSLFIDKHYQENCKLYIEDDTDGLFPLLFAMVHPTVNVYLSSDSPLIHLYSKSKNLPSNINFGLYDNNNDKLECICIIDNIVKISIIK